MPQRIALLPGTVLGNIVGTAASNPTYLARAVTYAQLDDVSLDMQIDDSGQGLSGGQMQRVMLARAIYRSLERPQVALILDEPTTSIDFTRAHLIRNQLKVFAQEGRVVIVASHESDYRDLADTVIEVGS